MKLTGTTAMFSIIIIMSAFVVVIGLNATPTPPAAPNVTPPEPPPPPSIAAAFRKVVNVTANIYVTNMTWFVNLSAANVTVNSTTGTDILVTDFDNQTMPYQTIIRGSWRRGLAFGDQNISNPWRLDNFTAIHINSSKTNCCFIYFANQSEFLDRSVSLLVRYDDFLGYPLGDFYPSWVTEVGSGGTICDSGGGRRALCSTGGAAQHFRLNVNLSNTFGHTVNIEFNSTASNLINGMLINDLGYRTPQQNPANVYNLLLTGGGSCGANATISQNFNGTALNVTFDRTVEVRNLYMRDNNNRAFHISCVNTAETKISSIDIDGAGAGNQPYAIKGITFYNISTIVRNQPNFIFQPVKAV